MLPSLIHPHLVSLYQLYEFRFFVFFFVGCFSPVTLTNLTSTPLVCYLDSTCTAVDCCIQVTRISRTLNVKVTLDPCSHMLTVELERFKIKLDLLTYTKGD